MPASKYHEIATTKKNFKNLELICPHFVLLECVFSDLAPSSILIAL